MTIPLTHTESATLREEGRVWVWREFKSRYSPFGAPGDRVHIRYKASVLGVPATMTVLATIHSTGPEQRDGVWGWFAELETKGSN